MAPLPLLVIVAGPPASGKTTLADRLAERLRFPLIHRDAITEALANILQPPSRDEMAPITQASFRAFYSLVAGHLARGSGVVCETNLRRGVAEADLRPLIAHARTVLIYCAVDREVSVRRLIDRVEWGDRHWCYFDAERVEEIQAGRGNEPWDDAEPLDLDVSALTVDTTDGYDPSLDDVLLFARRSAVTIVPPQLPGQDDPGSRPPPSNHRMEELEHVAPDADYVAPLPEQPALSRSGSARAVARVAVAGGGFVIGAALVGIALLALVSADRPLHLNEDELGLLGVNPVPHPTPVLRASIRGLTTPETLAFDLGPSTAGIQQPAPTQESAASAELAVASAPTREPPTPTAITVARRATIQAPAGFNGAFLREAPATSAPSVRQLSNGTPVEVLEGSAAGDGFTWARVRTQDGAAGWIVSAAVVG